MSGDRGARRSLSGPANFPIAHVHWALPPVAGGTETHLADFTRALAARGHPVTVFTGRGELDVSPLVTTIRCEQLDLDRYADLRVQHTDEHLANQLAVSLRDELRVRGIKVVHGHNLHHFTPVPAMALERIREELGLRLHHTYHSYWDLKPEADPEDEKERALASICRTWPGQHAASDYIKGRCEQELNIRTIRTHFGVAWDRYRYVRLPAKDSTVRTILLPARLMPEKGAANAVSMLGKLRTDGLDVRLILTKPRQTIDWTGESQAFHAEIKAQIADCGLGDVVEFHSARFDEMHRLFAQSDIVIYPSTYPEPFGIAPLEAGAAGRPVVVTATGGLTETVVDGVTGFIVPTDDIDALTEKVRTLLENPPLARRLGKSGRRHVRRGFTIDAYAKQMIRYYKTL